MNSLNTMRALLEVQQMVQILKNQRPEEAAAYDRVMIGLQPIVEKYGEAVTQDLDNLEKFGLLPPGS